MKFINKISITPAGLRTTNGWLTIFWLAAAFPICIFLAQSVPFLVFISVYAVCASHLSAWQSGRVEVYQDEQDLPAETVDKLVQHTTLEKSE